MKIKALLFDFDGLVMDTETPEFQVWQNIYHEHGYELTAEEWGQIVGGWGMSDFDAATHLVELAGDGLKAWIRLTWGNWRCRLRSMSSGSWMN